MRILKHKRWVLSTLISAAVIASFLLIPWLPQSVGAVAPIHPLKNYLDDLLDVNVPTPTNNYIIYWNNTSGYWEARAEDTFVCSDLASCNITDLGNVNAPAPNNGDILFWNNTASEWQTKAESGGGGSFNCSNLSACNLTALGNVNVTSPTNNYIIFWNNTSGYWEARAEDIFVCSDLASCNITELGNVDAPAPNDNDILFWNDTAQEWQTKAGGIFNCSDLNTCSITNLSDVNVTSPTEYDFLIYDSYSGIWLNQLLTSVALQIGANLGLHQLGNVNATLLQGYILYWDIADSEFKMKLENAAFTCSDLNACNISELANVNATSPSDGDFISYSAGLGYWQDRQLADTDIPTGIKTTGIIFIVDGGGSTIATGEKGHLEIPFNCTIQQVTMAADQTGSIVVDIWKDTYANFPPTNADSITNATPPTITTALKSQDSTLTNWTTTITTGDILAYNVDSCTNITRVTVSLQAVKT